jgi:hypothetical protein
MKNLKVITIIILTIMTISACGRPSVNTDSQTAATNQGTTAGGAAADTGAATTVNQNADEIYEFEMFIDDVTLEYGINMSSDDKDPDEFADSVYRDMDFAEILDGEKQIVDGNLHVGDLINGPMGVFSNYEPFLDSYSPEFDETYFLLGTFNGKLEIELHQFFDDGTKADYYGGYENNERNGIGLYREYDENGDLVFENYGEWQNDMRNGIGRYTQKPTANSKRWYSYLGEFKDGERNGYSATFIGGTGEITWDGRLGEFDPENSGYYENGTLKYTLPYEDRWVFDDEVVVIIKD